MPSLLSKLLHPSSSSSRNPYAHPSHPHSATPAPPPSTTAPHTFSPSSSARAQFQPPPPPSPRTLRPASPREQRDYLAEAREALNRDPVTGRSRDRGPPEREAGSVYQETNGGRVERGQAASGTKYDLYVQEMKARKGGRWRAPDGGFFAPERKVEEFYASSQRR